MSPLSRILATLALTCAVLAHPPAAADSNFETRNVAARTHVTAIRGAWDRLAGFIRAAPAAGVTVPVRLPYTWLSSADVPAAGDWETGWSERGLDVRYCGGVLLVYAAAERLMLVDQRTVRSHGGLHWLDGGVAHGLWQAGTTDITLPACMGSLPDRRVALAGRSRTRSAGM